MPIVETKVLSRPNTSVPFFNETDTYATVRTPAIVSALADGSMVNVYTKSEDQLTQTLTQTYTDLTAYSACDTGMSIVLDAAHYNYTISNGITAVTYTQTGIDAPFTQTITYLIPSNADLTANIEYAITSLQTTISRHPKLSNLQVNTDSVAAVFQFDNSADFTSNYLRDNHFAVLIQPLSGTRTIEYKLV
jgi:hypothetical protein